MKASITLLDKCLFQKRSFNLGNQAEAHLGFVGQLLKLPTAFGVAEQNPGDATGLDCKRIDLRLFCRSNGLPALHLQEKPGGRQSAIAGFVKVTDPMGAAKLRNPRGNYPSAKGRHSLSRRLGHALQNPDRQQRRDPLLGLHGEWNRPTTGGRRKFDRQIAHGRASTGRGIGNLRHLGHAVCARPSGDRPKPFDHGLGKAGPHGFH